MKIAVVGAGGIGDTSAGAWRKRVSACTSSPGAAISTPCDAAASGSSARSAT